jgi:hypothetical protein
MPLFMKCARCGTIIIPVTRLCGWCGYRIRGTQAAQEARACIDGGYTPRRASAGVQVASGAIERRCRS